MTVDQALFSLHAGLSAALPSRRVTRSFKALQQRSQAELQQGVVTLISRGESDYSQVLGREAQLGKINALLIGQLMLPGNPEGQAVEQAELALAEEIKAFLQSPMPAGVQDCLASRFAQSGQLETPYGWVVFELEVMSDE
jgi:hypothetical protein